MWSLQGRALQSNQMQSHTSGGAQREVNSGMPTMSGPGFWLGQQDSVSRAEKETCSFTRSCCATSILSFCQEAAFPPASRDRSPVFTPGLLPDHPPPRLPARLSPGWPHPSMNGASPCLMYQKGQQGLCTIPGFQTFPACLLRNRAHRLPMEQFGHSLPHGRSPCFPVQARQ